MIKLTSLIQMNSARLPRAVRLQKRHKQEFQGENGKPNINKQTKTSDSVVGREVISSKQAEGKRSSSC